MKADKSLREINAAFKVINLLCPGLDTEKQRTILQHLRQIAKATADDYQKAASDIEYFIRDAVNDFSPE